MSISERLNKMGIVLPEPPPKAGIYKPVVRVGNFAYVSGQGCTQNGIPVFRGKIGSERTIEEGQYAARICALNALSVMNHEYGSLERIKRVIKTLVFVSSADDFFQQPKVANGASELFNELFGEDGIGSRSAIGVYSLPDNIPVEIEFIFEMEL